MSRLRAGDGQSTTCHHPHLKDRRVCPAKCQRYRVVCQSWRSMRLATLPTDWDRCHGSGVPALLWCYHCSRCSPLTVITVRYSGRRQQPSAWQRQGKQDSVWPYKELLRRVLLIGWQSVLSRRTAFSALPQPAILTLFSTSNDTRRVLVTWDWNKERCLDWSVDLFVDEYFPFYR